VLGLVRARDLDEAIRIQNASEFGLTGGIHSLDDDEITRWRESVEVGNAYINRPITGAIVRRQPFGGWKRSCFGPGAKAGGPNYVAQFGAWENISPPGLRLAPAGDTASLLEKLCQRLPSEAPSLVAAAGSDAYWDKHEFSIEHDPTGLRCESNRFRYRRFKNALLRATASTSDVGLARLLLAAAAIGTPVKLSLDSPRPWLEGLGFGILLEDDATLAARFPEIAGEFDLVRAPLGDVALKQAVIAAGRRWADAPVLWNARVEWPAWLREQAVSRTLHRYGNLILEPPTGLVS
jgi:RHH-type proline utilization regulon transcriptional repressor/proline dehydrogenase/delta 1-pyrroline-5-carboxylate dehydrogenase